jgi:serine/threonine protein phosphatase 1
MQCGGDKTLESYPNGIPDAHWEFMRSLKPFIETDECIFVHAGLNEAVSLADQDDESLMWNRLSKPLRHASGKSIYCGHSSQPSGLPISYGSAVCIDCTGWLTAIDVDTNHVYQVNSVLNRREFFLEKA